MTIAKILLAVIGICAWAFLMHLLRKSNLNFWHFLAGSCGLFIILMVLVRPWMTDPLARIVSVVASIPGRMTGMYQGFYKYGIIFVNTDLGSVSLKIDFECSGIIEIMAFVSLLAFYKVYSVYERVLVGVLGTCAIILANALRISVIAFAICFFGVESYYITHAFIGRIVFYSLSVLLYFYVFTRPQIIKQKVGSFRYGSNDK